MVADESSGFALATVIIVLLLTIIISIIQLFKALLFSTIAVVLQLLWFTFTVLRALYVIVAFATSSLKF